MELDMKYVFMFLLVVTHQRVEADAFLCLKFTRPVPCWRFVIGITWDTAKKTVDIFPSPEVDRRKLLLLSVVMGSFHELHEDVSAAILITKSCMFCNLKCDHEIILNDSRGILI